MTIANVAYIGIYVHTFSKNLYIEKRRLLT